MAERPRELDQRFQVGVNLRLNYRLKGYFSRHCDMTQFTLTHHNYGKQTISSTRPSCKIQVSDGGCDQRCGRPSDVCDTDQRTKFDSA